MSEAYPVLPAVARVHSPTSDAREALAIPARSVQAAWVIRDASIRDASIQDASIQDALTQDASVN